MAGELNRSNLGDIVNVHVGGLKGRSHKAVVIEFDGSIVLARETKAGVSFYRSLRFSPEANTYMPSITGSHSKEDPEYTIIKNQLDEYK